ncbi:MAG: DUF4145 domain-containing protein [Gammaproteobacteria bacterium]|nr:DUF4145 domain-containing protein [Pseudomonadales bacterium]
MLKLGSQLALPRCPHCGVDSPSLMQQHRFETDDYARSIKRVWAIYACMRCGKVVTAWMEHGDGQHDVQEVFPESTTVDDSIPGKARQYLEQALNSLGAPAGAVMLAASAVDSMLKEKGYTENSLYNRIDKAAEDGLITNEMAQWAHEVRLDANDQRHADVDADLPNQNEASQSIEFARALAQFMFVLPSRVRRGIESAQGN